VPGSNIPYSRFLEIRRRRQRVAAELTRPAVATANGDSLNGLLVTIDCEALSDEHGGTRSALATSGAEDCVGRDDERARPAPGWSVRPVTARDRDPG